MKQLFNKTKSILILVLALSFLGCEDDDVTLPQVVAGFTHTINMDTGTVTFINVSTNATAYSWRFGDATDVTEESTSSEINPIKTYTNGTYTIILTASNLAGASDTFQDTITIGIPESFGLPITFDNAQINYEATVFNGAAFEIVANPDLSGTNDVASNVGAITNSGAAFEGFFFDLTTPINLATEQSIKMNFWSNSPVDVLLKLEEGTDFVETTASHGGTGWEEITFTFASTSSFSIFTLFVDGPGTASGTFYMDDVIQTTVINPSNCVPETSESIAAADLNITFQTNTPSVIGDNASFAWIDNPDAVGPLNTSCKVGEVVRFNNSPFDNIQIDLADKLDFNASEGVKMKVWSPVANTPVLLKLEEIGNSGNFVEISQSTGAANTWTELTYDFPASATPQFNKMVIFFNFNVADGSTYYFDDVMVYGTGGGGSACTAETSESIAAANLNITFQTDSPALIGDNTAVSYIDNPDFSGSVNSSCRVAEVTRFNASPFDNVQIDLADKLDFNASEGMKMKVWSPVANTPVLLKLEEIGNAGNFVEILQNTGAANTWTELTYDFAPTATPQFNKLVIFFNFNVADGSTYYFDDLMVYGTPGGGGTGNCPTPPAGQFISDGDFEANGDCWVLFDSSTSNGGTTTISTTVSNGGGTNSGQIETAPGGNPGIKQERFGVGTIQPNTTYVVEFDIKASSSDMLADGAVFQAFTFSEPADGSGLPATQHILIAGDANVTDTWVPRSYTFTTSGNVDGGVSLLFELVCGGAGTCTGTINIDNVSLVAQ